MRFRVAPHRVGLYRLVLFNNAESAYCWHCDPDEDDDSESIDIRKGDFVDVEWLGCEVVYTDDKPTFLNLVNVAFARESANAAGFVVDSAWGWVTDEILPMKETTLKTLSIKRLKKDEGLTAPYPFPE